MKAGEAKNKDYTLADVLMEGVELLKKLTELEDKAKALDSDNEDVLPEWHQKIKGMLQDRFTKKEGTAIFIYADTPTKDSASNYMLSIGGYPAQLKYLLRESFKRDPKLKQLVLQVLLER